eukprot:scaffold16329_cov121-Isochrysis_galbana.AAC.13
MPPEVLPSGIRSHADGFHRMAEALRAKVEASLHGQDEETKAALLGGPSLEAPINTVADKWKLLPAFLKVRGLVKQHLDSYNHLIGIEMQQIVKANELVTCEADPNFYMRFLDVSLGEPSDGDFHDERTWQKDHFTPQECRLRDITYSAPIRVRPAASRDSAQLRAYVSGAPPCLEWTGCIAHPIPVQSQPQLGPARSLLVGAAVVGLVRALARNATHTLIATLPHAPIHRRHCCGTHSFTPFEQPRHLCAAARARWQRVSRLSLACPSRYPFAASTTAARLPPFLPPEP